MKVHYDEGIANHIGPEPCAGTREGIGEASVGERIGQPLSRESSLILGADAVRSGRQHGRGAPSRAPGRPGVVGDPGMCARSLHGNREISSPTVGAQYAADGPHREGEEPKPMMYGPEKSDPAIVAVKPANKAGQPAAESVEPRAGTKGNAGQQSTRRAQNRESVSPGAGPCTASRKAAEEGEVHRALPPRQRRSAAGNRSWRSSAVPPRGGRADMAGLRGGSRAKPHGSARPGP